MASVFSILPACISWNLTPKQDLLFFGHTRVVFGFRILWPNHQCGVLLQPGLMNYQHPVCQQPSQWWPISTKLCTNLCWLNSYQRLPWHVSHLLHACIGPCILTLVTLNFTPNLNYSYYAKLDFLDDKILWLPLPIWLHMKPCVIWLWWFISILYIKKLSEWWLTSTKFCTNLNWHTGIHAKFIVTLGCLTAFAGQYSCDFLMLLLTID